MKKEDDTTWFVMPYELRPIPSNDETSIRFPEIFVEKFLLKYTKEGDRVLDPFAGFGTTLLVAQKMKRIGVGIEYDTSRYEFVRSQLKEPTKIIHGDALKIDTYDIAPCDFSITSPPYMQSHHQENPLTNYTQRGDYKQYLSGIRTVYANLKKVMKKDAIIILEVSNIVGDSKPMTPLAWDIAREISKELFFERELVYCHENGTQTANTGCHSYCLMFRNR